MACFFGLWIAALVVLVSLLNPLLISSLSSAELRLALELESLAAVAVPAAACPLLFGGVRVSPSAHPVRAVVRFLVGAAAGAALFALSLAVLALAGALDMGEPTWIEALPLWLAAIALNAAFQELLIHGYALTTLCDAKGLPFAVAATTAVFVLLHPGAFACGPVAVAVVAVFGVLLALVRLRCGGLAGAIGLHAAWNALGGIGFGLVTLADDYPSVFSAALSGPAFLSGGSMGIEGSAVTLVIGLAACAAALALGRRARSNREGV